MGLTPPRYRTITTCAHRPAVKAGQAERVVRHRLNTLIHKMAALSLSTGSIAGFAG